MNIENYIDNLPLAPLEHSSDVRRSDEDSATGSDRQDKAPGTMAAAVNASSLLSFVDGIKGAEKEDVLYSMQFASRVASAAHDRFDETPAWYRRYIEILERIGWAGEQFVFSSSLEGEGGLQMDKSVLGIIGAIATGNQLSVLTKSIEALQGLADDDGAIDLFEFQSSNLLGGNFQVGAVQKGEHDLLSIALGGFYFRATEKKKKFLFVKWRKKDVHLWTAAQRMVFNPGIYSAARERIKQRLLDGLDFIEEVPISND